jgi:hypothetical protein
MPLISSAFSGIIVAVLLSPPPDDAAPPAPLRDANHQPIHT